MHFLELTWIGWKVISASQMAKKSFRKSRFGHRSLQAEPAWCFEHRFNVNFVSKPDLRGEPP
jgi:hypothetical protein